MTSRSKIGTITGKLSSKFFFGYFKLAFCQFQSSSFSRNLLKSAVVYFNISTVHHDEEHRRIHSLLQKYGKEEPLKHAVKKCDIDAVRSLLKFDIFLNLRKDDRLTHLHDSVANDCFEIMKLLLEHGHSANARDDFGRTAIQYAAFNNNIEAMKLLIKYHASVNAKNNIGDNSLHRAAYNNSIAAIKFLFEKGANIHEKNNGGWTPSSD